MSHHTKTETGMRPHEIALAMRNARLARQRRWIIGTCLALAAGLIWLALSIGGGELLRWGFPK